MLTRGIDLNINFKVKAEEFLSHSVTVCEICYAVAIAEHHLMATSREFALAQSIPVKVQNVAIDIARGKECTVPRPVVSSQPLHRWRFMFYFNEIVVRTSIRSFVFSGVFLVLPNGLLPTIPDL